MIRGASVDQITAVLSKDTGAGAAPGGGRNARYGWGDERAAIRMFPKRSLVIDRFHVQNICRCDGCISESRAPVLVISVSRWHTWTSRAENIYYGSQYDVLTRSYGN